MLHLAAQIQDKARRHGISYQFAKRVADLSPQSPTAWLNLGRVQEQLYLFDDCYTSYQRGLAVAHTDEQKGTLRTNYAAAMITRGQWEDAELMARAALKYTPNSKKARANLGMACLSQRKWREGWPLYDEIIGFDQSRRKMQYGGESEWTGKPGQKVVVYGEQGLGDEITFASMIPDAINRAGKIIIDCEPRLAGLFRRSFPQAKVYGTLTAKEAYWEPEDRRPDASITVAGLGKLFRLDDESFSGEPYLVPDPDRVAMWKGLFDKQQKPVIGIAWSGGVPWTGDRFRRISLEEFMPLFEAVDAVWISLQYKDASKEIAEFRQRHPEIDLRQYAFGTLTKDYDDTAAMVAALDLTIAPPTSVVHLAGAMGAHCIALKAPIDCWKFHAGLPFHTRNMRIIPHAGSWAETTKAAVEPMLEVLC